jgi:hypothetical protein
MELLTSIQETLTTYNDHVGGMKINFDRDYDSNSVEEEVKTHIKDLLTLFRTFMKLSHQQT